MTPGPDDCSLTTYQRNTWRVFARRKGTKQPGQTALPPSAPPPGPPPPPVPLSRRPPWHPAPPCPRPPAWWPDLGWPGETVLSHCLDTLITGGSGVCNSTWHIFKQLIRGQTFTGKTFETKFPLHCLPCMYNMCNMK